MLWKQKQLLFFILGPTYAGKMLAGSIIHFDCSLQWSVNMLV